MTTTNDTRTDAERKYDAERDGSLYTRQDDDPTTDQELLPEERLILAAIAAGRPEPRDHPFATLADGTVIYGTFDGTIKQGWYRMDCVTIDTADWFFTVDSAGYVAGGAQDRDALSFEDVTIAQLQELRAFLNTGILERMQEVCISWARGDAEPPSAPMLRQGEYWRGWEDGLRAVFEHARKRLEARGELPAA